MSAAAERAELARIGESLVALAGERGERRARTLGDRRATPPAASFADLAKAPAWLQSPRDELTRLAIRTALVAMAPALAASIDGAWLRELASTAGEEALDHAIARADAVPLGGVAPVATEATEALGFDLLRANLAAPLHRYLDWAPGGRADVPTPVAAFALAEAWRP